MGVSVETQGWWRGGALLSNYVNRKGTWAVATSWPIWLFSFWQRLWLVGYSTAVEANQTERPRRIRGSRRSFVFFRTVGC
ncbi:hypothetical protein MPNT_650001 [Candidatus Methylacidithermus pantelleriae]|uniref:Uncharacterized protein n=1 Tax=Candidatus Methylacidithermus pantelleriae TaxID=2744239 RepID=A0A8J2FPN7_9BACT|nr:hypothetical protein MPNT_650001 [Candidatus Methylacidithermus pantelleriae]